MTMRNLCSEAIFMTRDPQRQVVNVFKQKKQGSCEKMGGKK